MDNMRPRPWHPFRHPGFCGLRGTTCIISFIALIIVLPLTMFYPHPTPTISQINVTVPNNSLVPAPCPNHTRVKRTAVTNLDHPWLNHSDDTSHSYGLNTWWRYANYSARSMNHSKCYVCSRMPVSVHTPRIKTTPLRELSSRCFVIAGLPKVMLGHFLQSDGYFQLSNGSIYNSRKCAYTPVRDIPGTAKRFKIPVQTSGNYSRCYARNGTFPTGYISPDLCNEVFSGCSYMLDQDFNPIARYRPSCLKRKGSNLTFCQAQYRAECLDPFPFGSFRCYSSLTFNVSTASCPAGYNCTCTHPNEVPDEKGTRILNTGWWLCGHYIFAHLPTNWSGVCAPVAADDHTIVMYAEPRTHHLRLKRADPGAGTFTSHDAVWGSDVPDEFKHWSSSEKVALALFPWVGVAKNILRLETVDYRLKSFTNITRTALGGIREELTALRLTVVQNRMALDLLTAPQGGVCAMVGDYCCTYIPENDADGHVIDTALKNLTALQKAMSNDRTPSPDWFTHLWSTWKGLIVQIALVILCFLVLFSCIIPLIRSLVHRALTTTLVRYSGLPKEDVAAQQDIVEPSEPFSLYPLSSEYSISNNSSMNSDSDEPW